MYSSGMVAHIFQSPEIHVSHSPAFEWVLLQKDPGAVPPAGEWQLRVCIMLVMDRVGSFADIEPTVMLNLPGHFRSDH